MPSIKSSLWLWLGVPCSYFTAFWAGWLTSNNQSGEAVNRSVGQVGSPDFFLPVIFAYHLVATNWEVITALATVALAFFTAALFRATYSLAKGADDQGKEIAKGVRSLRWSAVAAWRSAKTAKDQIEIARNTAKQQSRAYLHVVSVDFPILGTLTEEQRAQEHVEIRPVLVLRNSGQTMAFNVQVRGTPVFLNRSDDKLWHDMSAARNRNDWIVRQAGDACPPQADFHIVMRTKLPRPDEYEAFLDGTKLIYLAGHVTYSDIFGASHSFRYGIRRMSNGLAPVPDHFEEMPETDSVP